ncbi:hypothetical protein JCM9157_1222 [Halalkalibacter akibai JCM 9157]|uniref:Uncharacterized protein n=1 Tax=Halalkalibacter akibai (strain ATCC 43226 / DSM 21942 / CIP 109018 / JCM 9157 / 1139) TaxID=1236973 RepID=W4QS57_HALA3|nr:hypothetical protein JCM9157_1222 [Halalkalibacter akibai JCM 9157]
MEWKALDSCGKRGKGKARQTERRGGLAFRAMERFRYSSTLIVESHSHTKKDQ